MPFADEAAKRQYHREYYERNKHKGWNKHLASESPERREARLAAMRAYMLSKMYGISVDDYERMKAEQGNRCAICKEEPTAKAGRHNKVAALAVDHCHKTGKVRRLLCTTCNLRLGWFERYKDAVSSYLHEGE
jgi:Recombination endonuclease VII